MDQAAVLAILRHALTAGGAYLVTSGCITSDQLTTIVGAIIAVAPVIWSLIQKRQQKVAVIHAAATGQPVQAPVTSTLKAGA
jgi:hypothetical protein